MQSSMERLGLDKLPRDERLQLVHDLWDSIAKEGRPTPQSEEFKTELLRRSQEADEHPEDDIPLEVVKENLRKRLGR